MHSWHYGPVSSLLTNEIVDKDTLHLKWNEERESLYIVRSEIFNLDHEMETLHFISNGEYPCLDYLIDSIIVRIEYWLWVF